MSMTKKELVKMLQKVDAEWLEADEPPPFSHYVARKFYEAGVASLSAKDAEVEMLKRDQAVCHCGILMSNHTQLTGCNSPVEMQPQCPYAAELATLREQLRTDNTGEPCDDWRNEAIALRGKIARGEQ